MRSTFVATALAALLGVSSAALPAAWVGTWQGEVSVLFGEADPNTANSLECFAANIAAYSRAMTFTVNAGGMSGTLSAVPREPYANRYNVSAIPALTFSDAGYANSILTLSPSAGGADRCFWANLNGTSLTLLDAGGVADQCVAANYDIGANYETEPICNVAGASPTSSTTFMSFTGGAATVTPSPSPSVGAATRTASPSAGSGNSATGSALSFGAALVSSIAAGVAALVL